MKMSIRHISRHGRFLLVLLLAIASFMPGVLHAAAMAESGFENGHHMAMHSSGPAVGDQSMMSHNHAGEMQKAFTELPPPLDSDQNANPCCPMACSVALCLFEPEWAAQFLPDSFETEPMPGFVALDLALLERPPRV